jgi:succinate dehydrogenase / fumarate reductase cytochrome b subunit
VGKKIIMAVTGMMLVGFLMGHLLGNLQIFTGEPSHINAYGALLHAEPALLWVVRLVLLTAVGLHVVSSAQLWLLARAARPVGYYKKEDPGATYAARTMVWSGPIVAAFVIFHILHLTMGKVGLEFRHTGDGHVDVYTNVVTGFQNPVVSGFYIVAMAMLCLHLYHGVWSMFQSLGVSHPKYTPLLKKLAVVLSLGLAIGNISIPVSILAGVIHL